MNPPRKLYRSRTDRQIEGVCGGIAEYLNVDATLVRIAFALALLAGFGGAVYIVLIMIIPEAPEVTELPLRQIETPAQVPFDFDAMERERDRQEVRGKE